MRTLRHWAWRGGILGMAAVAVLYGATHAHRPAGVDAGLAAAAGAGNAAAAVNGAAGGGAGEASAAGSTASGTGAGAVLERKNAASPGSAAAASTAEAKPAGGRSDSAGGEAGPAGGPGAAGLSQAGETAAQTATGTSGSGNGGHSTRGAGRESGSGRAASSPAHTSQPAPAQPAKPGAGEFTIVVSEDNGATVIAKKTVPVVTGESLMDYMHQYFTIATAYGDNFMVSINGIRSQWTGVPVNQRQPVDWFLYVNGQQAQVGAADIYPHAGDVDTWDYHRWDPAKVQG